VTRSLTVVLSFLKKRGAIVLGGGGFDGGGGVEDEEVGAARVGRPRCLWLLPRRGWKRAVEVK
jgi:hypothetical protein